MEKKSYTSKDISNELKAIDNESLCASRYRREISRLKLESGKKDISNTKKKIISSSFCGDLKSSYVDKEFEEDIEVYLDALNSLRGDFSFDDVCCILPSIDDYDYLRVNYRLQCEIIKSIKTIMDASKMDSSFLELLPDEEKKLEFLREAIVLNQEDDNLINTSNKIILVPNLSGNISIIDDVERLPYDVYNDVLELINSIIEGTFKRKKSFTRYNDLSGIGEVRKGDLRVIYARINNDTYAIITTFLKKIETDQYYRDNLNRKANNYRSVEEFIRENLENPDFILENDLQVQRLFSILKRDDSIDYGKVLEKGGINE